MTVENSCKSIDMQRKPNPEVLKLGLVSFLTDLSSEAIFSVFAVFFTTVAGASSALLGLIEGLADFSASSLNYVAGWLSDRSGKRKVFALAGYGFSTLAKTILLVSTSVAGLSAFRVIEGAIGVRSCFLPSAATEPIRRCSGRENSLAGRRGPHVTADRRATRPWPEAAVSGGMCLLTVSRLARNPAVQPHGFSTSTPMGIKSPV